MRAYYIEYKKRNKCFKCKRVYTTNGYILFGPPINGFLCTKCYNKYKESFIFISRIYPIYPPFINPISEKQVFLGLTSIINQFFYSQYQTSIINNNNEFILKINEYPIYPDNHSDIYLKIKGRLIEVVDTLVLFRELKENDIKIYLKNGINFVHPEFSEGTPMYKLKIKSPSELFSWYIASLLYKNVSLNSFCNCSVTWENIEAYRNRLQYLFNKPVNRIMSLTNNQIFNFFENKWRMYIQ